MCRTESMQDCPYATVLCAWNVLTRMRFVLVVCPPYGWFSFFISSLLRAISVHSRIFTIHKNCVTEQRRWCSVASFVDWNVKQCFMQKWMLFEVVSMWLWKRNPLELMRWHRDRKRNKFTQIERLFSTQIACEHFD